MATIRFGSPVKVAAFGGQMPNNRKRGSDGENEFARLVRGTKISRTGYSGPDVIDSRGRTWEVKRIKKLPALLLRWLHQTQNQKCMGLAFRADRGKWYLIVLLEEAQEEDWI